jgi:hypothetical protein
MSASSFFYAFFLMFFFQDVGRVTHECEQKKRPNEGKTYLKKNSTTKKKQYPQQKQLA